MESKQDFINQNILDQFQIQINKDRKFLQQKFQFIKDQGIFTASQIEAYQMLLQAIDESQLNKTSLKDYLVLIDSEHCLVDNHLPDLFSLLFEMELTQSNQVRLLDKDEEMKEAMNVDSQMLNEQTKCDDIKQCLQRSPMDPLRLFAFVNYEVALKALGRINPVLMEIKIQNNLKFDQLPEIYKFQNSQGTYHIGIGGQLYTLLSLYCYKMRSKNIDYFDFNHKIIFDCAKCIIKLRVIIVNDNNEIEIQVGDVDDPQQQFSQIVECISRHGPQVQIPASYQWVPLDENSKQVKIDDQLSNIMNGNYDKMLQKNKDKVKLIKMHNKEYILLNKTNEANTATLIDHQIMNKYKFQRQLGSESFWDYLETFNSSHDLGYENGQIWKTEELDQDSFEYKYVSTKFLSTSKGRDTKLNLIPNAVDFVNGKQVQENDQEPSIDEDDEDYQIQPQKLQYSNPYDKISNQTILQVHQQLRNSGQVFQKFNMKPLNFKIVKIEKIYNQIIYERCKQELTKQLSKYPTRTASYLCRHLFHGTMKTDPSTIYSSEEGLDVRFSRNGMNGYGIYFADNSNYSHQYTYNKSVINKNSNIQEIQHQMFLSLVLVGESSSKYGGGKDAKHPGLVDGNGGKNGNERYDSFNNGDLGHYVIYDNFKSYPGYLITYVNA